MGIEQFHFFNFFMTWIENCATTKKNEIYDACLNVFAHSMSYKHLLFFLKKKRDEK